VVETARATNQASAILGQKNFSGLMSLLRCQIQDGKLFVSIVMRVGWLMLAIVPVREKLRAGPEKPMTRDHDRARSCLPDQEG